MSLSAQYVCPRLKRTSTEKGSITCRTLQKVIGPQNIPLACQQLPTDGRAGPLLTEGQVLYWRKGRSSTDGRAGPLLTEGQVLAAEEVVDVVVLRGVLAGHGVVGVVAHQRLLVEDGVEPTDEGPHAGADEALGVHEGVADVEDAALVGQVRVEPVLQPVATEPGHDGSPVDRCGVGGKLVAVRGGVRQGGGEEGC